MSTSDLATYPGDLNTPAGSPWPGGYGMPTGVTVPLYGGFPYITFTSFSGFLGSGNRTSTRGPEGDLDLVESVSYLRGKHTFKFGFEYIENIADGITFSLTQGNVNFTDLQSYLQGFPQNWTILLGSVEANTQNAHSNWYAGFVQDDWRIRPRVMLNLGLRYEYDGPPHEQNNNLSTFNLNATGNQPAIEQVGPGLPLSRHVQWRLPGLCSAPGRGLGRQGQWKDGGPRRSRYPDKSPSYRAVRYLESFRG